MVNIIHIKIHRRNVKLAYTIDGDVKAKSSVGMTKFKNTKKASAYAFQDTTFNFLDKILKLNVTGVSEVKINGFSVHTNTVVKTLASKINISSINNITGIKHGGCKPKRQRST